MIFLIKKILHNYFSCFLWAFKCMLMDFGQPNGVALTKSPTGPQLIWVLKELLNFGKSFVRSKIGKMKALRILFGPWELGPIASYSICLLLFFSLAHVFFSFWIWKLGPIKSFTILFILSLTFIEAHSQSDWHFLIFLMETS